MERLYSISDVARAFGVTVATLRYYEECGLFQPVARRGRVRQYDRAALERLAYAQLWHHDGLMPLADTAAVMTTAHAPERHALITAQHDAMQERIGRLTRAAAVLRHMLRVSGRPPAQLPRHRCLHQRPRRRRPHRRGAPRADLPRAPAQPLNA
ncbi:MerR family transcriptional regulator [Streptomyces goshikiensis]|uniref:MerR family transcriptional regulator n=1 Tax=Streptomyces goshikiensis TaxID=1942 RepID=UPI002E0ED98E|nr:MerR family transcriptional regulator [Streptomyces goshikiensis]WSS02862.1 MerR family transcriptional regulator [Streptomyces goshikiensis]